MTVGRNDPCPCGSGKKYKKCCLIKENIIELAEHRREKFYTEKQHLVEKVGNFLQKQIPLKEYNQLKTTLIERADKSIEKDLEESFFTYWLYFYHHFDNGLRGIEWFYQANKDSLTNEDKAMTETWMNMHPRFLQAIDVQDEVVIFQDMLTDETFPLSKDEENIEHLVPWASTISMIEPFEDAYYFNGFRFTVEPLQIQYALEMVDEVANKKNKEKTQVLFDIFPELIARLLNKDQMRKDYGKEISEYTITYHIHEQDTVLQFLRKQQDFRIDKWLEQVKEIVWAGNWRVYHDSENYGPLQLADVLGSIAVTEQDTKLIFQTMHPEKIAGIKERFEPIESAMTIIDESANVIGNFLTKVHNVLVSMEDDMPAYFAIYAQNNIYEEIDTPIPAYNNLTIRECIEQGKHDLADTWLKTTENHLYKQILERFHSVEVTADFNTIRDEFGLAPSPFVTGGTDRKTELLPIQVEETSTRLLEEDIPYLEALGFTPESLDTFYISDIVHFYKEKTIGKSDATIRKYRNSLDDLRVLLEQEQTKVDEWNQCDQAFWEPLITTQYKALKPDYSKTERANFLSVLRTLLSWIDDMHETAHFKGMDEYLRSVK